MTHETKQTSELLRALVSAFVDRPENVRIDEQESPGACYFILRVDPRDEPKVIGTEGSHVRALGFLLAQIGLAAGKVYTFRLITDSVPSTRCNREPRDVASYDVEPAKALLSRTLEGLNVGAFAVQAGPGPGPRSSLTFIITALLREEEDMRALTAHLPVRNETERAEIRRKIAALDRELEAGDARDFTIEKRAKLRLQLEQTMTTIEALGTLFRAMAKRDGVRFYVQLEKAKEEVAT